MAKAVVQKRWEGEPWEKLDLVLKEIPRGARPGHVLIRLKARAIHPNDLLLTRSNYFASKKVAEIVIGSEGAGVIEAVGDGVSGLKVGQRVSPLQFQSFQTTGQGTWQQYLEVPESQAFPIPDDMGDTVAAQIFANAFTVLSLLEQLQIPEGEFLLQTGSGTGAGKLLVQLAKHLGIKTINIVRRGRIREELHNLGADEVVTSEEDIVERVKQITGGKLAYAAVDGIAGPITKKLAASVRDGGTVLVYGFVSGTDFTVSAFDAGFERDVRVRGWSLARHLKTPEDQTRLAHSVLDLLNQKVFQPSVGNVFDLEQFHEAMKHCDEKGGYRGPRVLLMG